MIVLEGSRVRDGLEADALMDFNTQLVKFCLFCRGRAWHLHDVYNNAHARQGVSVHRVQHGLRDRFEEVVGFLRNRSCFSWCKN